MWFAKWVFRIAGIYGLLVLTPMYFLQPQIAATSGPITHPEHFYGFVGVALTWQLMFLVMSRDPVRWRPAIAIAIIEKLVFGVPVVSLFAAHQVPATVLAFGCIDLMWAMLFAVALWRTRGKAA